MILVCGYGGDSRRVDEVDAKKEILKLCQNKKVAIIVNAKPTGNRQTTEEVSKFLTKNNISNKLFDLYESDNSWQGYDVIYFGGGSPLRLMQAIENGGFKSFDWESKDIVGQSAGAMILCKHFVDCDFKKEHSPDLTLNDFNLYEGLGIIKSDTIITPHYSEKVLTPHYNALSGRYGKFYLQYLDNNNINTIKLNDKEFLIF